MLCLQVIVFLQNYASCTAELVQFVTFVEREKEAVEFACRAPKSSNIAEFTMAIKWHETPLQKFLQ
jgi:hypothetical protein